MVHLELHTLSLVGSSSKKPSRKLSDNWQLIDFLRRCVPFGLCRGVMDGYVDRGTVRLPSSTPTGGQQKLMFFELIHQSESHMEDVLIVYDKSFAGAPNDLVPFNQYRSEENVQNYNLVGHHLSRQSSDQHG